MKPKSIRAYIRGLDPILWRRIDGARVKDVAEMLFLHFLRERIDHLSQRIKARIMK